MSEPLRRIGTRVYCFADGYGSFSDSISLFGSNWLGDFDSVLNRFIPVPYIWGLIKRSFTWHDHG